MIRQLALFLAAFIAFTPASAQTAPVPPPADVKVALETGSGRIVVAVHLAQAPVTAANFLRYVDQKRLDGTSFYRGVGTRSEARPVGKECCSTCRSRGAPDHKK